MDASVYRCLKHCSNCPFKDNGKAISLKEGRVKNIKDKLLESEYNSFNCHKTVYNLDENMESTKEQDKKMCYGAFEFLLKENRLNIQMRLALSYRIDNKINEYIEGIK